MSPEQAYSARSEIFPVRKAEPGDVPGIRELLLPWVKEEILLDRSPEDIHRDLQDTFVCMTEKNEIVGCVTAIFFQNTLCEVRALAVKKEFQGKGIGSILVQGLVEHLSKRILLRPLRIFALTYTPEFFLKAGFTVTEKENFPQKIYEVCSLCKRRENCRETAVEMVLGEI